MEHSAMFYKIKNWYEQGHWTTDMVRNAFNKGKITEEEYKEIVGENLNRGYATNEDPILKEDEDTEVEE